MYPNYGVVAQHLYGQSYSQQVSPNAYQRVQPSAPVSQQVPVIYAGAPVMPPYQYQQNQQKMSYFPVAHDSNVPTQVYQKCVGSPNGLHSDAHRRSPQASYINSNLSASAYTSSSSGSQSTGLGTTPIPQVNDFPVELAQDENDSTIVKECKDLTENDSYRVFCKLSKVDLNVSRLQRYEQAACDGIVPKFFKILEETSDYVAKTALKCTFYSFMILSAGIILAGPSSGLFLITMLPATLGFGTLAMITRVLSGLGMLLKNISVSVRFSSSLTQLDKKNLQVIKEWSKFDKAKLKLIETELNRLSTFINYQVPERHREEYVRTMAMEIQTNLDQIRDFKKVQHSLSMMSIPLTKNYLGIA